MSPRKNKKHSANDQINDLYNNCKDFNAVIIKAKGTGHFQVEGLVVVNHYPYSKNRTAYIKQTSGSIKNVSPCEAIQLALKPDMSDIPKAKRKGSYVKVKSKMWNKSQVCGICGEIIDRFEDATLDHIIPLSKGGLDQRNNYQLAHEKCNHDKGNDII